MLEREKTYRMAGRRHSPHGPDCEPQMLRKRHALRFQHAPEGQVEAARDRLLGLPGLVVEPGRDGLTLWISYSIEQHSFDEICSLLTALGFLLDDSLHFRLLRSLWRYSEETQLHNLHSPERLIKQSNEVYVQAWAHHPHGDHDDTPEELREFR